jgi:hypothetical protein
MDPELEQFLKLRIGKDEFTGDILLDQNDFAELQWAIIGGKYRSLSPPFNNTNDFARSLQYFGGRAQCQ